MRYRFHPYRIAILVVQGWRDSPDDKANDRLMRFAVPVGRYDNGIHAR